MLGVAQPHQFGFLLGEGRANFSGSATMHVISPHPASGKGVLGSGKIIGQSPLLQEVRDEIGRLAKSDAKVLVSGESGVGKELVAVALHTEGGRANGPFVSVNCAGLPETLLESELFGYLKGSFTGSYRDIPGKLEVAHGGTVFLYEIGE